MGRKRKALKLSCYYCDRDFVDEQTLILHQRARHFRCGSCDRQFLKVGDLVWHAQKKHGEAVLKVPNSLPSRDDPAVSVVGLAGIPDELEEAEPLAVAPPSGLPSLPSAAPPEEQGPPARPLLLWRDEEHSMEERRASLERYGRQGAWAP